MNRLNNLRTENGRKDKKVTLPNQQKQACYVQNLVVGITSSKTKVCAQHGKSISVMRDPSNVCETPPPPRPIPALREIILRTRHNEYTREGTDRSGEEDAKTQLVLPLPRLDTPPLFVKPSMTELVMPGGEGLQC